MKKLNLIYHNTYCCQTYQGSDLLQETPTLKVTLLFYHVVLRFWVFLTQFVGLEHKCRSRYWLICFSLETANDKNPVNCPLMFFTEVIWSQVCFLRLIHFISCHFGPSQDRFPVKSYYPVITQYFLSSWFIILC